MPASAAESSGAKISRVCAPRPSNNWRFHGQRKATRRSTKEYSQGCRCGKTETNDRSSAEIDAHRARETGSQSREAKAQPLITPWTAKLGHSLAQGTDLAIHHWRSCGLHLRDDRRLVQAEEFRWSIWRGSFDRSGNARAHSFETGLTIRIH